MQMITDVLSLKLHASGVHVADDVTHVADHSSEEENTNQECETSEDYLLKAQEIIFIELTTMNPLVSNPLFHLCENLGEFYFMPKIWMIHIRTTNNEGYLQHLCKDWPSPQ